MVAEDLIYRWWLDRKYSFECGVYKLGVRIASALICGVCATSCNRGNMVRPIHSWHAWSYTVMPIVEFEYSVDLTNVLCLYLYFFLSFHKFFHALFKQPSSTDSLQTKYQWKTGRKGAPFCRPPLETALCFIGLREEIKKARKLFFHYNWTGNENDAWLSPSPAISVPVCGFTFFLKKKPTPTIPTPVPLPIAKDLLDWPQRASNGQRLGLWRPVWSRALIGGANQLLVVCPRRAAHIKERRGAGGWRRLSSLRSNTLSHI
jgi:hypothetical protein